MTEKRSVIVRCFDLIEKAPWKKKNHHTRYINDSITRGTHFTKNRLLRLSRATKPNRTPVYTRSNRSSLSGRRGKEIFKEQGRIRSNIQTSLCTEASRSFRKYQYDSRRRIKERKIAWALTRGTRIANWVSTRVNSTVNYTSRETYFVDTWSPLAKHLRVKHKWTFDKCEVSLKVL